MRYFKKWDSRQRLLLSHGGWHQFKPAGDWGLEATADTFLIRNFLDAIAKQRGAVTEITKAEYEDLKKKQPSRKPFNEALSPMEFLLVAKKWRDRVVRVGADVVNDINTAFEKVRSRDIKPVTTMNIDNWRPASVKR